MLGWMILLGVGAIGAGLLGFVVLAGVLAFVLRLFFLILLALLVISVVSRWMERGGAPSSAWWRDLEQE